MAQPYPPIHLARCGAPLTVIGTDASMVQCVHPTVSEAFLLVRLSRLAAYACLYRRIVKSKQKEGLPHRPQAFPRNIAAYFPGMH